MVSAKSSNIGSSSTTKIVTGALALLALFRPLIIFSASNIHFPAVASLFLRQKSQFRIKFPLRRLLLSRNVVLAQGEVMPEQVTAAMKGKIMLAPAKKKTNQTTHPRRLKITTANVADAETAPVKI